LTRAFVIFFLSAADSSEELKTKIQMHPEMKIHYQKMSPNKLSVVTPHAFDSSSSQGGGDQINYGTTIFNRCSHQV
jgi:hypothetical protein